MTREIQQVVQEDIAFIGVFHGEGVQRLERLYRSVRPWFPKMIIALQGPTGAELVLTKRWADVVIEHPTMGYCEWSFNDVYQAARDEKVGWTFNLDGDELADPDLLSSLGGLVKNPGIIQAGGARFYRRNVFIGWDGQPFPSFVEETIRLLTAEAVREPVLHGHSRGTKLRPPLKEIGSIWQFRSFSDFLADHQRYLHIAKSSGDPASVSITNEYLVAGYRSMLTVHSPEYVRLHMPSELLEVIDQSLSPAETWRE